MTLQSLVRRWRPRTWIVAGAIVLVLAAGSIYWFGFGATGSQAAQADTRTVAASDQTLEQTVAGTGTLTPTENDDVNFAASGTVTAVNVQAGSTVTAGQTLATLDTTTENANLLSAKATLAAAQATYSNAEAASDGSAADVAQVAADNAAVAVAQAAVDTAQTQYDGTTLTSPIAGLVTAVNVAVGDVETAGSSGSASGSSGSGSSGSGSSGSGSTGSTGTTGTGSTGSTTTSTADFTVVGTSSWETSVSVGATDLAKIAVNDQVELSTDDNPSFFGTVASIGMLPSTTTGAATYPVTVTVTGSPTDLYDGVTVTAKIVYERRTNVLTVPSAAVTTANGTSTVEKVVNGKAVKTPVTVGETVGALTEITKGLSSGDNVQVTIFTPGAGNTGTTGRTGGFEGRTGGFEGGGAGGYGGTTGGTGGYRGGFGGGAGGYGGFTGGTGGTGGGNRG